MEKFIKGEIVVIPFPYSDLSGKKRRPALVLAVLEGNDLILCQITSRLIFDKYAVTIELNDYNTGSLGQVSNIRTNKIFTADRSLVVKSVGKISTSVWQQVYDKLLSIINESN